MKFWELYHPEDGVWKMENNWFYAQNVSIYIEFKEKNVVCRLLSSKIDEKSQKNDCILNRVATVIALDTLFLNFFLQLISFFIRIRMLRAFEKCIIHLLWVKGTFKLFIKKLVCRFSQFIVFRCWGRFLSLQLSLN